MCQNISLFLGEDGMAEKNNKKCIICGTMYSYCPNCHHDNDKPTWFAIFDGQNCFDIYEICTSYRDGTINKKTAFEKISICDITKLEEFNPTTKAQIEEILTYKAENTKDKVETETVKIQPKSNVQIKNNNNHK